MIPPEYRERLIESLSGKLKDKVRLAVFTQEFECEFCKETRELVEETASISDKIEAEIYDFLKDRDKAEELKIDKIPAIAILGEKDYGIRFYGIPAGFEYATLIEDIIMVSNKATNLSKGTKEALASIEKPIKIQVFVTLTCPYCPKAVSLAHQFAFESDQIRGEMVEATEFPHLAQKYAVMAVPKVVINEVVEFTGALPEDAFLNQILVAAKRSG